MDEAALVRRAAAGDAEAWEPLMRAHQEAVFRLAYLIIGDADEAEDVAQDTFIRGYFKLGRFDIERPLKPWLLAIAANLARNHLRSLGRRLHHLTELFHSEDRYTVNIADHGDLNLQSEELMRAVRSMDEPDRQIIYLRYFLELSVEESAAVLGTAEGTVKSRLHRAIERLRQILNKENLLVESPRGKQPKGGEGIGR